MGEGARDVEGGTTRKHAGSRWVLRKGLVACIVPDQILRAADPSLATTNDRDLQAVLDGVRDAIRLRLTRPPARPLRR